MQVGYIRVSSDEQNTIRQEVLLKELGIEKIYIEKISGANRDRKQLTSMLEFVREGDTVVVEAMSRLSRSALDFLNIVKELKQKNVTLISKKENIDTSTPQGRFMLTVFAGLSELERDSIKQRQLEGIKEAKKQGKYKGRQEIKVDKKQFTLLYDKWKKGELKAVEVMRQLKLKPNTFYRKVKNYEGNIER